MRGTSHLHLQHCKNLAPEYLKAAKSMDPLVKFYAVDCDEEKNKPLCGQQGIKGFPTVKVHKPSIHIYRSYTHVLLQSFPRGSKGVAHEYQGERKAKAIAEWVGQEVPNKVETVNTHSNVNKWTKKVGPFLFLYAIAHSLQAESKPRFLLLNAQTKLPLLWRVLSHNFKDKAAFAATRSKDKIAAITSGLNVSLEVGDKSKVLYWAPGETEPKIYEGIANPR